MSVASRTCYPLATRRIPRSQKHGLYGLTESARGYAATRLVLLRGYPITTARPASPREHGR